MAAAAYPQPIRQQIDDCKDVAALSPTVQPWKGVYQLLWQSGLDRDALHFAWRLLHKGLNLGSLRLPGMIRSGNASGIVGCLCPASSCAGQGAQVMNMGILGFLVGTHSTHSSPLETHRHAFWECPSVQPAVRWLWEVWRQISGLSPPLHPSVLIVGDPSVWSPHPRLQLLWLLLRVTFLHTIWRLRHRRGLTNQQYTSAAVVAATCATLERTIRRDFLSATKDLPRQSGMGQRWFRSKRKQLTLEEFTARWCVGGVLAAVQGHPAALVVHIPTHIPP